MRADIAKRLYEYRKAVGLSQEQVANEIGVSRQAVSKWECAESSPDTDNLIALAILYGVTVDELLFADPEEYEPGVPSDVPSGADQSSGRRSQSQPADAKATAPEEPSMPEDGSSDYVDISIEGGVHVKDSKKGEEVHVGWDGIHIDNDQEHVHIDFSRLAKIIREFRKDQE